MAIIINNIDTEYFELNNTRYAKIYQPLKQGLNNISITNVYDSRQSLINSNDYSEFIIDSTTYSNQKQVIDALLPVIYAIQPTELELLSKIKNVDGSGSGLDADLLDGVSSSGYAKMDDITNNNGQLTIITDNTLSKGLRLRNNTTGQSSFLWMDNSDNMNIWNSATGSRTVKINVGGGGNGGLEVGGTVTATRLNLTSLPTSAAGLSTGDVWNDGGTLKIV